METHSSGKVFLDAPVVNAAAEMLDRIQVAQQVDKAIIVCHGMGQQLPFETLSMVSALLQEAAGRQHGSGGVEGGDAPAPTVRLVKIGHETFPRVELTLRNAGGEIRTVHLYEAYWAPITEGKVSLTDTIVFLLQAGRRGWKYAAKRSFRRYMFGRYVSLAVVKHTTWYIAGVYLAVVSLLFYYFAFFAALFGTLVECCFPVRLVPFIRHLHWLGVGGTPLLAGALLLGWWGVTQSARTGRSREQRTARTVAPGAGATFASPAAEGQLLRQTISVLVLGLLPFVAAAAGMSAALWSQITSGEPFLIARHGPSVTLPYSGWKWTYSALQTSAGFLFWILTYAAINYVRGTIVQYVGDVAAYISPFAVSKFDDIRSRIQAVGLRVACAVYRARTHPANPPAAPGDAVPGRGDFLYRDVIVVGHSLGSVLAYDTLNAMINEDLIPRADLRVVERTSMLLTFGSPLDKTAFIFRAQARDAAVREALAAAVQPIISDYRYRPAKWVNIYSPADVISGALQYYDDTTATTAEDAYRKRVENIVDPHARTPLLAHVQYWENATLRNVLYHAL